MADFEVKGRVTLDDQASPVARRAALSFANLRQELGQRLVLTAGDLVNAFRVIPNAIGAVINAFADQEAASNRLATALRSLGPAAADVQAELEAQAAALQATTTASDEAIISGQALLAAFTKNTDEIKAATVAALDLSAATGTDLNAAFALLGKAAAGNTAALSRYGVIIDENTPRSEKFAKTLEAITKQFGGQAAAATKTFNGELANLKNQWGELLEIAGKFLVDGQRSVGVFDALRTSTEFWNKQLASGVTDMTTTAGRARELADAQRDLEAAQKAVTEAARGSLDPFTQLGSLLREQVIGVSDLQRAQAALVEAENRLAAARRASSAEAIARAEAEKQAALAAQEAAEQSRALADAFENLGVKSRQLAEEEIAQVKSQLELIRQEFLAGHVPITDYAAAVEAANAKLLALGDAAAKANASIKATAEEAVAAQEALAQSFRDEDDAAEAHGDSLDDTAEKYRDVAAAANEAAAGIAQVTMARSEDARTDVQIAQDNLAALDALGPFASGFGGGTSVGVREALNRKLAAAKAAEGSGPAVAGSTVGLGPRAAGGVIGGGTRGLAGW